MDIKGVIRFLEEEKRIECGYATQCKLAKKFNEVIKFLKKEVKMKNNNVFKQMWDEFKRKHEGECWDVSSSMSETEDKYFSEEEK